MEGKVEGESQYGKFFLLTQGIGKNNQRLFGSGHNTEKLEEHETSIQSLLLKKSSSMSQVLCRVLGLQYSANQM